MKVCLINNLFTPYERGGAEQIVKNLAQGFIERGHEVIIICTRPWFAKKNSAGPDRTFYLRSLFYDLDVVPYALRYIWHAYKMFDLITAVKVANIVKREKVELVIMNNLVGLSGFIPLKLKLKNLKSILLLHDIQWLHPAGLLFFRQEKILNKPTAKIYQSINRRRLRQVDLVVSPSRWLLNLYQQQKFFTSQPTEIIPNPIASAPAELSIKTHSDIFKILYVGQVEQHKGVLLLIQAMQNVAGSLDVNCQWELEIIGTGRKLDEVKALAQNNKRIKISGAKTNREVRQAMQTADLLVAPSLCYENYPTTIIEAILCGLPVLGADLGGVKEIIESYGGFLFAPGDASDLSAQILQLIKNPALLAGIKQKYNCRQSEIVDGSARYIKTILASLAKDA